MTNISCGDGTGTLGVGLTWNGQYQLTATTTNGSAAEQYGYDALGRRIWTASGGVTTYSIYDGAQVIADVTAGGTLLRSYTWGPGIDNLLALTVHTGATARTYYAIKDHLGSVQALVDASGNIAEQYRFDAWGRTTVYDGVGNPLTQSAVGNRYVWQGREISWATGLYYFRARWYDPVTGRWLSNDPISISGGLNQYVFCGNNPVNFSDPLGLTSEWAFWDPNSAVGRQFVSIGDAFGSTLARPFYPEGAKQVFQDSIKNSGQAILDESCAGKGARAAYWGAIGVAAAADAAAGWMIGAEALAAIGYYNVANTIANRATSPFLQNAGSRWFSQTQVETLLNGPRLANTGQGLENLLTTFRYASPGNGEVVLNYITRTVVHANPFF